MEDNNESTSAFKMRTKYVYTNPLPEIFPTKEEREIVYSKIFGNDVGEWRVVCESMTDLDGRFGWQQLPSGLWCTKIILDAKIRIEENNLVPFQGIFAVLLNAINHFVMINVEAYPKDQTRSRSIQDICNELSIPPSLVQLRNASSHAGAVFNRLNTLVASIDQAFRWLEAHYWNKMIAKEEAIEEKGCKRKMIFEETHAKKTTHNSHQDQEEEPTTINRKSINSLTNSISHLFQLFAKKNIALSTKEKKTDEIIECFERGFQLHPKEFIDCFVGQVFYANHDFTENNSLKRCCHCKSEIPLVLVKRVTHLVKPLAQLGLQINSAMVKALINQSTANQFVGFQWLMLIFGNILQSNKCLGHRIYKDKHIGSMLNWTEIVSHLLKEPLKYRINISKFLIEKLDGTLSKTEMNKLRPLYRKANKVFNWKWET